MSPVLGVFAFYALKCLLYSVVQDNIICDKTRQKGCLYAQNGNCVMNDGGVGLFSGFQDSTKHKSMDFILQTRCFGGALRGNSIQ